MRRWQKGDEVKIDTDRRIPFKLWVGEVIEMPDGKVWYKLHHSLGLGRYPVPWPGDALMTPEEWRAKYEA